MTGEPRRAVTIQEVAARAEVSVGTVSHVLSGKRFVAPTTRARVEEAMEALGYRPNRVARSLSLRRTHMLGMILPDVANPFFAELARGVEEAARARSYCVVLGNTDNDPDRERTYVTELVERGVDGLLVTVTHRDAGLRDLVGDLPVVAVDRVPDGWAWSAALVDNAHGMRLAVDHLVGLGHRRIAYIGGNPELSTARERADGVEAGLAAHGLAPVWRTEVAFTIDAGVEAGQRLLDELDGRLPSAVIAANDLLALGVLNAVTARGIRVPEELSIIGNDDIPFAALAVPALTTVRQPIRQLGEVATTLLLERLDASGDDPAPRTVRLASELVARASVRPVADGV